MEGCTTISCKFTVPGVARKGVLKDECTCQRDNKSARRFAELDKGAAGNSNSFEVASNQIARKQTANRESCTRLEVRELTNGGFVITLDDNTHALSRRTPRTAGSEDSHGLHRRRKFAVKKLRRCQSSTAS